MKHYHFKNIFFAKIALFFCISNYCMEKEIVLSMDLDLQSIGRFSSVSKKLQTCSFVNVYQRIAPGSICFTDIARGYNRCTKGLIYFAQQNKFPVFSFLWSFHAEQRKKEVFDFSPYNLTELSINNYMHIYAKEYEAIRKAKERKNQAIIKQKDKEEKEILKIRQDASDKQVRKNYQEINDLKIRLKHGCAELSHLHDQGINISGLFPHKNDKELLYLLCRNAYKEQELVLLAGKYFAQYQAEMIDYLFYFNKFTLMQGLITNGYLDVNVRSTSGKTVLHLLNYKCGCQSDLFFKGRCSDPQEMLDALIRLGADVNIADDKGMTVLHYACKHLHVKTIQRLLKVGTIDIEKKNKKNKKPIDYVNYLWKYDEVGNDRKLVKLLLKSHVPQTF